MRQNNYGNKLVHVAVECTKKTVATIVNGHPLMVADIVTMIFTLEELAQRGLGLIIKDYGITPSHDEWRGKHDRAPELMRG